MPSDLNRDRTFFGSSRRLRLQTLIRLRWLAVAGQTAAVLGVHYGLGFRLPLAACLAVIAVSTILNVILRISLPVSERLDAPRSAVLLAFDILQLGALLYLTGGMQNPFAVLFLAPVLISATMLPPVPTALLGAIAIGCATFLVFFHLPLPWRDGEIQLPRLYVLGEWFAILLGISFIGIYAWRVAEEARQLNDALAATELVLAREQHLSALDGLAAAAAHELGTPLSTIALVARELDRALPGEGPVREDIDLLRGQVERCREILGKLTSLDEHGSPHDRLALRHLLEEVVAPHREFGPPVEIEVVGAEGAEPIVPRNSGILYGLGNLIENAVDFARGKVRIEARWSGEDVELVLKDDGPGFAPEILARLGDPYVTTRGGKRPGEAGAAGAGLGLGAFIAKTLLERSGAAVAFANTPPPGSGAVVRLVWPRPALESGSLPTG